MINCQKTISKCKAECCTIVPFPKDIDTTKACRPFTKKEAGDYAMLLTKDLICPFLSESFMCLIYKDRPDVCRKFGYGNHPCLTCTWQDSNGVVRPRSERSMIRNESEKYQKKLFKI